MCFAAQPSAALESLLERAYGKREFSPKFPKALRWMPDGESYAVVEGNEIVRYSPAGKSREVLVSKELLTPANAKNPIPVEDYSWSKDRKRVLIFTNTKKVWRDNTRGDYWVLDLTSRKLRKLGGEGPESTLMFAKFSPDAKQAGYVRLNDIYVEEVESGKITRLTSDGSPTRINGTSDWVYEEELSVRDCFNFSPDGSRVAFWNFDATGVGDFVLVNQTDSVYPKLTHLPYPKVGTTNSAVRVGVLSAKGGDPVWLQIPGDPREHYIAAVEWAPRLAGSTQDELVVQQLNRLQNQLRVYFADPATGKARLVFEDKDEAYIEVRTPAKGWVDGNKAFLWTSERDGWRHYWSIPRDGSKPKLLTDFAADVISFGGVDEKAGWIYFTASPDDAAQRLLYRAKLDGSSKAPERITPASQPGVHQYTIAPGARFATHVWSRMDKAPAYFIESLPDHKTIATLQTNDELNAKIEALGLPPTEFFQIEASGFRFDAFMIKPPKLDATKRYPVLVYVYGEPGNVTVADAWLGNHGMFHRALALEGFVVVSIENRGTPSPRGRAFRRASYGSVGVGSSQDQADALRALLKQRSYLDPERIAIWGWSGGGTNTLNAMFRHGDLYKAGLSVAPVPDLALYDTIYQERYMGLPTTNAEGFKKASAINHAEGLKGKLLLMHGSGDDNVHIQGTERLINRLVELDKPFDLMVYPNRTHSISEGKGTSLHVRRTLARYLLQYVEPGPR
jgi:dipeptidyl-peptidase 4